MKLVSLLSSNNDIYSFDRKNKSDIQLELHSKQKKDSTVIKQSKKDGTIDENEVFMRDMQEVM